MTESGILEIDSIMCIFRCMKMKIDQIPAIDGLVGWPSFEGGAIEGARNYQGEKAQAPLHLKGEKAQALKYRPTRHVSDSTDKAAIAPPLHDALVRLRFLSLNRTGSTPDDALVRAPRLRK